MGVHKFPILNPSPNLPPHIISLDHPHAPAPNILYPVSNLDWWFISYMIVYMFQCNSPKSSQRLHLPQNPKVYSRFWIIFTIVILNSFSGRLPISSSCLVWIAFIMFLYLLNSSRSFHFVSVSGFGVAFLYARSLYFLFIVEYAPGGWGWMNGLSRFPA